MCNLFKNDILLILTLFFTSISFSQTIDSVFVKEANALLEAKPTAYFEINQKLKKYNRDSLQLQYLVNLYEKNQYLHGESYALNAIGIYCRNTSQYDKAILYHNRALEKAKEADDKELRVNSLNMLGVVYRRIDDIRTALDYHQEALALAETIEERTESVKRSIAVSLNSMGNIFLVLEQYDLAVQRFTKSMKIEESVGNKLGLAINYHNIGYAKEATGDLEGALIDYKESLRYNNAIDSDLGRVICNNTIGRIYIKQKKYKEAINIISSTLERAKGLRDKFHLSDVYINLGWAYLEMDNNQQAKKYLNEGLAISKEYNLKSSIAESYTHLANLAEKEKEFEKALNFQKQSYALNEEITNEKNFKYVNDLIIKYDKEKFNLQIENLEKENENVKLTLKRNKSIWITSSIVLAFLAIMIYILYRQRLLNNEKKILTLEQDMLRSQMNPHFVFNSLNSIKQYIIANEQKNAVHYLNKFAKLIRKILDASRVKVVSLGDELETMDLYMSIENIRFSNEINFEVFVDNDINLDQVKIPSLILQPFLENALWHGLSSKKGQKNIKLSVTSTEKNFVTIAIADNGIGREAAKKITDDKIIKRKSIGIALTRNRLANFVKNFKNSFSVEFLDLKDQNNTAIGTEVVMTIPLH
ncbi:tetratricopeptide repeat protein [Kordia sp. YSTF-M3]|uniref:Tetratricopeptide repeat protein n=1 Tax=Kordia aestuariivivens TaxID=2759037 RepID=A0ABR7QAV1_9FLAO|nr:tetratricopeptide repeat protein [Kordia aestuariivivens]MBC8755658.1 tetratricopeptide repeat protein [Kordia aestuariivivens]